MGGVARKRWSTPAGPRPADDPAFGETLLNWRAASGLSALAHAAIGAEEEVTAPQEALVRRLHAAGSILREMVSSGKTMLEVVQSNQPAVEPLLQELLATETA